MFKTYKDVEKFLDYLEDRELENTNLKGEFIYKVTGYRKYADTEFLNYLPNYLLAKMLYGVISNSELDLSEFTIMLEE